MLLGAAAGVFSALALREFFAGSETLAGWIRVTIEPLRRARAEGYLPNSTEKVRISLLAVAAASVAGLLLGKFIFILVLASPAPIVAALAIRRNRMRYRRAVERAVPDAARAVADCLSAGHSPRGALVATSLALDGPAGAEFGRLRHELELGRPTDLAVSDLAERFGSERIDAFAAALISQRFAGGDLASLLRRFAEGAAERDQVAEDARSATAQARFTGYLVVAMPVVAGIFAEAIRPGIFESILSSMPATMVVATSLVMQSVGFAAIFRLARIEES